MECFGPLYVFHADDVSIVRVFLFIAFLMIALVLTVLLDILIFSICTFFAQPLSFHLFRLFPQERGSFGLFRDLGTHERPAAHKAIAIPGTHGERWK